MAHFHAHEQVRLGLRELVIGGEPAEHLGVGLAEGEVHTAVELGLVADGDQVTASRGQTNSSVSDDSTKGLTKLFAKVPLLERYCMLFDVVLLDHWGLESDVVELLRILQTVPAADLAVVSKHKLFDVLSVCCIVVIA